MCAQPTSSIYSQLEIPPGPEGLSAIGQAQAEYIYSFLKDKNPTQTLEVGFAFGCSAAHIMAASEAPHIAIDPFQVDYHHLGLKNIERLGMRERLRLVEELSHIALPKLLAEGLSLDFAFIDGGHRFDDVFLDWCYVDRMLKTGGYVMFDDAWMRATQLVGSFVRENRSNYREVSVKEARNVLLFQKTAAEDARPWSHFREFHTLQYRYQSIRQELFLLRHTKFAPLLRRFGLSRS